MPTASQTSPSTHVKPRKRLIGLREIEAEYGVPYGTLYDLVKRGILRSVQLPGVRRIYIDRSDLEDAIQSWKVADA
jgi:excisionase family DNA binding protein